MFTNVFFYFIPIFDTFLSLKQKFLDQGQYTRNNILKYEKIFGENFVSTGGLETTEVGVFWVVQYSIDL